VAGSADFVTTKIVRQILRAETPRLRKLCVDVGMIGRNAGSALACKLAP
jgi:hypothetical protein